MVARGPQNGRQGPESGLPLGFWALLSTFTEKTGEGGGNKKRIKVKIVANNVVASRPPTATPTTRANWQRRCQG